MYERSGFSMLVWALVVAPTFLTPAPSAGSVSFEQVWTTPPEAKRALHKVLTLYVSPDASLRSAAEDKMATAFRALSASPAASVLSASDYTSVERTRSKLRAAGYDGIVSIRLLAMDDDLALQGPVTYRRLETYWASAAPEYGRDPKIAPARTSVRIETNSYALEDGSLVWSGLSEPIDAATAPDRIEDAARAAAVDLAHAGMIPTAR